MSIYKQGSKIQVTAGDKRVGEFATVSQTKDYGVFAYVGDDKFETYFQTGDIIPAIMVELAPPAPATAPAEGAEPHPEALAAQIVHAQMVLQDALGYEENDYNVSLTDLALDIEALRTELAETRQRLAAAEGARDAYKLAGDNLAGDILTIDWGRTDLYKWLTAALERHAQVAQGSDGDATS